MSEICRKDEAEAAYRALLGGSWMRPEQVELPRDLIDETTTEDFAAAGARLREIAAAQWRPGTFRGGSPNHGCARRTTALPSPARRSRLPAPCAAAGSRRPAPAPRRSSAEPSPLTPPENPLGSVISNWQRGDILTGRLHQRVG